MQHLNSRALWLVSAAGMAVLVWGMFAAAEESLFASKSGEQAQFAPRLAQIEPVADGRSASRDGDRHKLLRRLAQIEPVPDAGTPKEPNLSLWVPEEELAVWDPVNPNVNPVPWRVFGPIPDEGKRTAAFRHTAIDQQVRVEGLAWGYDVETELPTSRVVFEGGTVLVEGVDFHRADVLGKTVRVVGTLRLEWMPQRGFERQFPRYYCLEAESFEVIERVTDPRVVLVP
jgi:hypothetical protein